MSKKLHGFMKRPQNGAKHVDALNTQRQHRIMCSSALDWVAQAADCLYLAPGKTKPNQTTPHYREALIERQNELFTMFNMKMVELNRQTETNRKRVELM